MRQSFSHPSGATRTHDIQLPKLARYQLRYTRKFTSVSITDFFPVFKSFFRGDSVIYDKACL